MTAAQSQSFGSSLNLDPTKLKLTEPMVQQEESWQPMEPGAYQYWNAKGKGRKYHLVWDMVWQYSDAAGRPLRLDEMQMLVGNDGDEVECYATEKMFQPLFWIEPTTELLDRIRHHKDVVKAVEELDKKAKVVRLGHFFLKDGLRGKQFAFSGNPYFIFDGDVVWDKKSACVRAAKKNAQRLNKKGVVWGYSRIEIEVRIERADRVAREAEQRTQRQRREAEDAERRAQQRVNEFFN